MKRLGRRSHERFWLVRDLSSGVFITCPRGSYPDGVVEYSTRTGQALANVAPSLTTAFPGPLCVPLWTDPSGQRVVTWCQHGQWYDRGRVSPVTLHRHMNGTDILPFAW